MNTYELFKKNPPNSMNKPRKGPATVVATVTVGEAAETKWPNETEVWAHKTTIKQHIKNFPKSEFNPIIQYIIVVNINGNIKLIGSYLKKKLSFIYNLN